MPKISVLMPVYNAEAYLAEAIESVINQTFGDWELLIGDDGSTDDTEKIVQSYVNDKIRYYKNPENKGHTFTKYSLLDKSTGEYIAFLDADDVSLPERFEKQVAFLDCHPDYGLCGTWGSMINPDGSFLKKMRFINHNEDIRCALLFNTAFLQSSIMVKRQLMKDFYYDKDILLVEDYNFGCHVSRHSKTENLTIDLVKYRWHNSNISNTKQDILNNLNKKIYKRELSYLGIDATDKELDIHNAVRDKTSANVSDKVFFKEAKIWFKKLAKTNKTVKLYDQNTFRATICFRWIYACKERKAYATALKLPIALNPKSLVKLLRMIYIKSC
ncbi:MAG: glycosyltransferase family 2 protein [Dysgonomonas sp.]